LTTTPHGAALSSRVDVLGRRRRVVDYLLISNMRVNVATTM